MLGESAVYLLSYHRTPQAFRRHLPEAIGLWARGRRQVRAWTPHIERTRAVIKTAIEDIPGRRTVAVLGAGPLFDVPVEALARSFDRVLLIDIAHLWPARRRIARLHNVETVWRDLAPPDDPAPLAFLSDIPGLDWVISVNVLSQLAHAAAAGEEYRVVERHLSGLDALAVAVTMVTDTTYRIVDRSGVEIEQADLSTEAVCPPPQSWTWDVAPFGEEAADSCRTHTVAAYPDWHATRR